MRPVADRHMTKPQIHTDRTGTGNFCTPRLDNLPVPFLKRNRGDESYFEYAQRNHETHASLVQQGFRDMETLSEIIGGDEKYIGHVSRLMELPFHIQQTAINRFKKMAQEKDEKGIGDLFFNLFEQVHKNKLETFRKTRFNEEQQPRIANAYICDLDFKGINDEAEKRQDVMIRKALTTDRINKTAADKDWLDFIDWALNQPADEWMAIDLDSAYVEPQSALNNVPTIRQIKGQIKKIKRQTSDEFGFVLGQIGKHSPNQKTGS